MNLYICGIIDIIIVILFITAIILGYKKGFMEKFINIANSLCGLVFSVIFAGKFAKWVGPLFLNDLIQPKIYDNVIKSEQLQMISDASNAQEGIVAALNELGLPNFLSEIVAKAVGSNFSDSALSLQDSIATAISGQITSFVVVIISFIILFFGVTLLCFLLKIILKVLRTSTLIRVVDGLMGVIFNSFILLIIIYIVFIGVSVMINIPAFSSFKDFIMIDMQLGNDNFRISKYLYENNIIGNIFKIFF